MNQEPLPGVGLSGFDVVSVQDGDAWICGWEYEGEQLTRDTATKATKCGSSMGNLFAKRTRIFAIA